MRRNELKIMNIIGTLLYEEGVIDASLMQQFHVYVASLMTEEEQQITMDEKPAERARDGICLHL